MNPGVNPELLRGLWLTATPGRLVATATITAAVLGIALTIPGTADALPHPVGIAAALLFAVMLLLLAPFDLVDGLGEEHRDNTWDAQRVSTLPPWSLLWGRWLGTTAVHWAFGLPLLVLAVTLGAPAGHRDVWLLLALALALTAQAGALLYGLVTVAHGRPPPRTAHVLLLVGLLAALVAGQIAEDAPVQWFGWLPGPLGFVAASLVLLALCAATGAWAAMCAAVAAPVAQWVWPGTGLLLGLWLGGLYDAAVGGPLAAIAGGVAVSGLGCSYAAALVAPQGPLQAHRTMQALGAGDFARALAERPAWFETWAMGTAALLLLSALAAGPSAQPGWPLGTQVGTAAALVVTMIALRDLLLGQWLASGTAPHVAARFTLLLLVLHGLLPLLLRGVADPGPLASGRIAEGVQVLFTPTGYATSFAVLAATLHAGLAGVLLWRRWRHPAVTHSQASG